MSTYYFARTLDLPADDREACVPSPPRCRPPRRAAVTALTAGGR
ncbi:hypothetical protein [Rhodocaloribacter litoris]|nr:hypothetical protein [Rhodocaloribacter litoris]